MTANERLARSLHDVLAERDPGPAPERLARRVAAARAAGTQRASLSFGPLFRGAAATAVVAVVIALAVGLRPGGGLRLPGGSGAAPPPGPPVAGVGLATPAPPVVPVILIGALLVCGVVLLRRVPDARHRAAVAVGVLSLAYAYSIAGANAEIGLYALGVDGATSVVEGGDPRYELRLEPDEQYRFIVGIQNRSAETVTIVGLDPFDTDDLGPRPVGLGWQPAPDAIAYENAIPFRELTLRPDERATLIVLGSAGRCASPRITEGYFSVESIHLVTRVAGWERPTEIPLIEEIAIGFDGDCLSQETRESR